MRISARIQASILTILAALACQAQQQPVEGTSYYLPKTALRISVLQEKTTFSPGEYARYAGRYMKLPVREEEETTYRIVGVQISSFAIPDSARHYQAIIDKKHTLISLERDENGILKAINTKGKSITTPAAFVPSPQPAPLNPRDFMTEEILSAASSAKMAELIAREIYDIRESRNMLSRGEAEFMPKDGEQLRLMLGNLQQQEQALLQMFAGTTKVDTTEHTFVYVPTPAAEEDILFRFSRHLGLVDNDDLAGEPYYIHVVNQNIQPKLEYTIEEAAKRSKEDIGINVCLPGRIMVTVGNDENTWATMETMAAQFGRVENLSANLFSKKYMTRIVLNPITGTVEQLLTEPLE